MALELPKPQRQQPVAAQFLQLAAAVAAVAQPLPVAEQPEVAAAVARPAVLRDRRYSELTMFDQSLDQSYVAAQP